MSVQLLPNASIFMDQYTYSGWIIALMKCLFTIWLNVFARVAIFFIGSCQGQEIITIFSIRLPRSLNGLTSKSGFSPQYCLFQPPSESLCINLGDGAALDIGRSFDLFLLVTRARIFRHSTSRYMGIHSKVYPELQNGVSMMILPKQCKTQ